MDALDVDKAPRVHENIAKAVKKGLVMVHTGEGKGKTTAGLGMVLRCLGRGYKVAIVQFIKGKWIPGELKALRAFGDQIEYHAMGDGFTWDTQNPEQDKASARKAWEKCLELIRARRHHLIFLDEINYVVSYGFLDAQDVVAGIKEKDPHTHVLLTGRNAAEGVIAIADLVTEMKPIKHPYRDQKIKAQPGIEF
jgi:cob(I)alamin adenosyltransferase